MAVQLCTAHHPDAPPRALGELRLCPGHHARLLDALTGPSVLVDPTIDCTWGYAHGRRVLICADVHQAVASRERAVDAYYERALQASLRPDRGITITIGTPPGPIMCGDGTNWYLPGDYRPGGLARDWAALQLRERTLHTGEAAPYATGSSEPALPIDDRLADLRSQIMHDLAWWIGEHARQLHTVRPGPATVHQAVEWLARHRDWSAAQPFAGEYVAVLTELRARIRRVVDLPPPRRTDVGPCIEHDRGRRCTGRLYTVARDPGDPTPVVIQCDTCPAAYDSARWKRLGERLKRAA